MSPWVPGIWLALSTFAIIRHTAQHGQPRDEKFDGVTQFIAAVISGGLLWWGGFFTVLVEAVRS